MKPILRDLHWLPVQQRIWYKIALLTFKALHGMAPKYVSDLVDMVDEYKPSRSLRSSSKFVLRPQMLTMIQRHGDRAFATSAPHVWNKLPCYQT